MKQGKNTLAGRTPAQRAAAILGALGGSAPRNRSHESYVLAGRAGGTAKARNRAATNPLQDKSEQ